MYTLIERITTINLALFKIQDDWAVVKFNQGTENASTTNDQVQGHVEVIYFLLFLFLIWQLNACPVPVSDCCATLPGVLHTIPLKRNSVINLNEYSPVALLL